MYSKVKIGGHPIHPMLVAFPITLYLLTFVGFLVYQMVGTEIFWYKLAYFANFAAIATALLAAVPGFLDWTLGIPKGTAAKKHGLIHMILNLATLAIFTINASLIWGQWDAPYIGTGTNLLLTGVGSLTLLGAGYFGWEMIAYHKVGVDMSPEQEKLQERYEREEPFVPPHNHKQEPPSMYH